MSQMTYGEKSLHVGHIIKTDIEFAVGQIVDVLDVRFWRWADQTGHQHRRVIIINHDTRQKEENK